MPYCAKTLFMTVPLDGYGLSRFTEAGVMVRFHIKKSDKDTKIIDWELISTWLYHYYDNEGKYRAKIISLENIEKEPYNFSDDNFRKALKAKWDNFYIKGKQKILWTNIRLISYITLIFQPFYIHRNSNYDSFAVSIVFLI